MKIFTLFVLLLTVGNSFGQMTELKLDVSCKGTTTGFQSVKVIDNRSQNQLLGLVQSGASNKSTEIVCLNLIDNLATYFMDSTSRAVKMPLVLILNEFFLNEAHGNSSETGRFRLSMQFFVENSADQFTELVTVDTIYTNTGRDVTKALLRSVSAQLCILSKQVSQLAGQQTPSDLTKYSYQNLLVLDSLEKRKLPMYSASGPQAGIYRNYNQFKLNEPEPAIDLEIEERKNGILVYAWDEKRKKKTKLLPDGLFAVSDGTTLLRATGLGFYKMIKEGADFYYWRPRPNYANSGTAPLLMGVMFGAVGGLAAGAMQASSKENNQWLLQKVNYRRGNSVPVSWVNGKPK
ncbi:hypothetical protein [Spirosoma sp.]|uniref:hypothetical protein n=1 Tax=Spirosoma sp. TaxID=1899569 RepID=UPI0026161800|nr:hypothetical protein [Spirosoma sp.]MCX6214791.1 hypothetical protein [Spirosoma sp.]